MSASTSSKLSSTWLKNDDSHCFVCRTRKTFKDLKRCGRCKGPLYCSAECQQKDWPSHKPNCVKATLWYDGFRACRDGSVHEGKLELIAWEGYDENGRPLKKWSAGSDRELAILKHKFEDEFKGDLKKFFGLWPRGFRWTCCGVTAAQTWGCDHHGSGSKSCTCDFCHMGKPLPEAMYNHPTASRKGLTLLRGPDPRSYNPALAMMSVVGRKVHGLQMPH
ncbi:set and mynd domain containing 2 [Moniliophthora roreri MCA 2997]|uniref:MYND-type domain-containing protein n=2 Tax=Moniliophthora roreri TaxID=221103 RepID=A0A0W0G5G0_MONRR|nr:set and mynd domain containing 2 [Moniliophthora roreri MCA 2997]KAI3609876.1 set and mynd domain containing 2 [Moniliophthora roreri]